MTQLQPQNPPDLLVSLPYQIEPDWHEKWGPLLAGFLVSLVYVGVRPSDDGSREPIVVKAEYTFDLGSFSEDDKIKKMRYVPSLPSDFYVDVVWNKLAQRWETSKFRGETLIALATGSSFDRAMVQTLLIGLQPDEPAN